jgi:hypothetical protein
MTANSGSPAINNRGINRTGRTSGTSSRIPKTATILNTPLNSVTTKSVRNTTKNTRIASCFSSALCALLPLRWRALSFSRVLFPNLLPGFTEVAHGPVSVAHAMMPRAGTGTDRAHLRQRHVAPIDDLGISGWFVIQRPGLGDRAVIQMRHLIGVAIRDGFVAAPPIAGIANGGGRVLDFVGAFHAMAGMRAPHVALRYRILGLLREQNRDQWQSEHNSFHDASVSPCGGMDKRPADRNLAVFLGMRSRATCYPHMGCPNSRVSNGWFIVHGEFDKIVLHEWAGALMSYGSERGLG